MWIADKLLYVGIPKTASNHICYLLENIVGGEEKGSNYNAVEYREEKLIVGSIRNPWEWYISAWAFGCALQGNLAALLTRLKQAGPETELPESTGRYPVFSKWADIWKDAYQDCEDRTRFRTWLKLLLSPEGRRDIPEGYAVHPLGEFAGFMTHRYCMFYVEEYQRRRGRTLITDYLELKDFDQEHNFLNAIIRNEFLEVDFTEALEKAGYTLDDQSRKLIEQGRMEKTNTSKHYPASFYYDQETIDLVADKEQYLIEKHGYQPPKV